MMRGRSFQRRIALLASLVSGVVLSGFGLTAWWLVQRMDMAQLDQSMLPPPLPRMMRGFHGHHLRPEDVDWEEAEEHARGRFAAEEGVPEPILLVIGSRGEVIHQSAAWPEDLPTTSFPAPAQAVRRLPEFPHRAPDEDGPRPFPWDDITLYGPGYATHRSAEGPWRTLTVATEDVSINLSVSLLPHVRYVGRVGLAFLAVLPVALLVIAGGSWWMARRAMRPVITLTETAERITARGLDQRIPVESEDVELRRLIAVFNDMMTRLERSFHQAVRFSADAAHELRTPLTIIQGELEQAIRRAPTGSREQQQYSSLLAEVQRLRAIVGKLLLLSQADAGGMPITPEPLDFTALVRDLCEDAEAVAPHLSVEGDLEPDVCVPADEDLLARAVQNLFGNAVQYNRDGGRIEVTLESTDSWAKLTVANTGPGIPPEHREAVFERFHRVDEARSRDTGGVGLGLSLAREIALAHDGDLTLDDAPEGLTSFTLTVPLCN